MTNPKFSYKWTLKNANFSKDKGKVFSCFSCGGGSSMGYKLAGIDEIGCNDVDPKMMEVYSENHNPKYSYTESIATLKDRKDLPKELIEIPKYGVINIHCSLLPKWRGAAPIQRALLNKDKTTGITFFRIDESLDTGKIISKYEYKISE